MLLEERKYEDDRFRLIEKESKELLTRLKKSLNGDGEIKRTHEEDIKTLAYEIYKVRLKYNLIGDSKTDWFIAKSFILAINE